MDHEPNKRETDEGRDKKQSFKDNLIGVVLILLLFGILLPACSGSCGKSSSSDWDGMSDHEKKSPSKRIISKNGATITQPPCREARFASTPT